MITGADTSILLDVLVPGASHAAESEAALTGSLRTGAVIFCDIVYSELAARFPGRDPLDRFLSDTGMRREPATAETLIRAGQAWGECLCRRPPEFVCPRCSAGQEVRCPECGSTVHTRQHLLADFFIGAHAAVRVDRLLTRDRG
jgi:hypothetical protein